MRHLTEERLVGLVLEDRALCGSRTRRSSDAGRQHLARCAECRAKYEELNEVTALLDGGSRAVAPVLAWSGLKGRMERSRRPVRDWTEPRWVPLVAAHLVVVVAALALIVVLGGWLESSRVWEWMGEFELVRTIGPRGLVGLAFLAGGGLCVLALTPVLWWESRSRG